MSAVPHCYSEHIQLLEHPDEASALASARVAVPAGSPAVFDIDDTLLRAADMSANPGVLGLYKGMEADGHPMFVVTARHQAWHEETQQDLERHGVAYRKLYSQPELYYDAWQPQRFKWEARRRCKAELSVGDQWTDHLGSNRVIQALAEATQPSKLYELRAVSPKGRESMACSVAIKLPDLTSQQRSLCTVCEEAPAPGSSTGACPPCVQRVCQQTGVTEQQLGSVETTSEGSLRITLKAQP